MSKATRHLDSLVPEQHSLDDLTGEPHAVVFDDSPRTVRLSLAAGESMPEHDHPGEDVLFVLLSGRLDLVLDGEPYELTDGDLVRLDGECRIEPRAVEDSVGLVVFAPRE